VAAVVSFLLLSGFVMTALIRKYYLRVESVPAFYLDRLIRLAPQFYLYITLTLLGARFFRLHHFDMQAAPGFGATVSQFLLVPLNFYFYFPDMLLPQAWSLGLEAMFYAVFPFILIFKLRNVAALISLAVFAAAQAGYIDVDLWGYRFLPGTLIIFICGSWLEDPRNAWERRLPFIFCGACALLLIATYFTAIPAGRSVLLGVTLGIPVVYSLQRLGEHSRLSALAGDLSYGVFLNHVLLLAIMLTYTHIRLSRLTPSREFLAFACICGFSTLLSYASFTLLEKPFIAQRRNLRSAKRADLKKFAPPSTAS
jgi:peptidoglycan/LPS O-acetylase OafA/YrhL